MSATIRHACYALADYLESLRPVVLDVVGPPCRVPVELRVDGAKFKIQVVLSPAHLEDKIEKLRNRGRNLKEGTESLSRPVVPTIGWRTATNARLPFNAKTRALFESDETLPVELAKENALQYSLLYPEAV